MEDAPETLSALRTLGHSIFFLTNNSSQPRRVYVEKLTRLGMPCEEREVVTSASVTADYVVQQGAKGARVLVVGGLGIADELERVGVSAASIEYADTPFPLSPTLYDYVIAGLDREFTYHKLHRAQQALLSGAKFIATNRDAQYPIEGGRVIPGGGSIVAAIAAAANREPVTMGKPETMSLQTILASCGAWPHEAMMIGDRLDTDIACGNKMGVPTTLVLTGVSTREEAERATPDLRPTRIITTLRELL